MNREKLRTVMTLLSLLLLVSLPAASFAASYSFSSIDGKGTQNDLKDLDHYYYYIWGINWSLPQGEYISRATIQMANLTNYKVEEDILKMYIVDNPKINDIESKVDILYIYDAQRQESFYELSARKGIKFEEFSYLTNFQDPDDQFTTTNFSYDLDAAQLDSLNDYLDSPNSYTYWKDGQKKTYNSSFGLGFDPDCHYYNDGITFTINTDVIPEVTRERTPTAQVVPEPSTISLMLAGALALGVCRRFRRR